MELIPVEEEDDKLRDLEAEIIGLRRAKNELNERAKPINDELERIVEREKVCVEELQRLTAEKSDRVKLEVELKRVLLENELLKSANSKCTVTIDNLKQSLDEKTAQLSKAHKRQTAELNAKIHAAQQSRSADAAAKSETANGSNVTELQEELQNTKLLLSITKEELNETRHQLSDVQERLTVVEQVTEATQHRALLEESGNSEQLMLTQQHQSTTRTGFVKFIGPIPWGHGGPLCHALSLSLASSWTSMRRRRATVLACDSSDTW